MIDSISIKGGMGDQDLEADQDQGRDMTIHSEKEEDLQKKTHQNITEKDRGIHGLGADQDQGGAPEIGSTLILEGKGKDLHLMTNITENVLERGKGSGQRIGTRTDLGRRVGDILKRGEGQSLEQGSTRTNITRRRRSISTGHAAVLSTTDSWKRKKELWLCCWCCKLLLDDMTQMMARNELCGLISDFFTFEDAYFILDNQVGCKLHGLCLII